MNDQADATGERPGERARLLAEMRRIKETSGLSFGRLADRTHYSRSSWERFLNGKQLPTCVALEQLAEVAGEDPAPLLALLERISAEGAPAAQEAQCAPSAPAQAGPARQPDAPARAVAAGQEEKRPPEHDPADRRTTEPPSGDGRTVEPPPADGQSASRPVADRRPEERNTADRRPGEAPQPGPLVLAWSPRRRRRLGLAASVVAGAVCGSFLTVLALSPSAAEPDGGPDARASISSPPPGAPVPDTVPSRTGPVEVGCRRDACIGRDPKAADCQWDAVTAHDTWLRGMHIQLRYSEACQAVWGRVENGTVGDTVRIKGLTGLEMEATIRIDRDTYTKMLAVSAEAPPRTVTVCGAIPSQKQMECSPHRQVQP
ncbi:DUF2690 domain-containing protein [Streptomyces coeruleoprunus]|uniref:DUF2690 domain-containing protein n=1 Tax=Streptomyces coeruleoprunus TaxID=285563 RepID=A0ABV9XF65_9ACTN